MSLEVGMYIRTNDGHIDEANELNEKMFMAYDSGETLESNE